MNRTIAAITTSRADFSHLVSPLKRLHEHSSVSVRLIAMGAHLSPEFGLTVRAIEECGIAVDESLETLLSSDTDVGMAKTIGTSILSLADVLGRVRPDILLVIADRYEMLAPASVALALRIPIAHIEGGDVSEGAIDDAVRNALTKMSHIHFTPTAEAARRVLAMGEEPWRVHRTGAPSLDVLTNMRFHTIAELSAVLGVPLDQHYCVVSYHPVTMYRDTLAEADALFTALRGLDRQVVFCFPNADAGSRELVRRARDFVAGRRRDELFINLDHPTFMSLLKRADCLIGNSSAGIMETPTLRTPTINVGVRQQGRVRAPNVVDSAPAADAIRTAIEAASSSAFRESLADMSNPYGDGRSGERVADVLANVDLDDRLLWKRALPLAGFAGREHGSWEI